MEKIAISIRNEAMGCNNKMNTTVTLQDTLIGWDFFSKKKKQECKRYRENLEGMGKLIKCRLILILPLVANKIGRRNILVAGIDW